MTNNKTIDYGKMKQELDTIIESMQADELDIDQAIKQYQRGMKLIDQMQDYIKNAQNSVTKLKKKFK